MRTALADHYTETVLSLLIVMLLGITIAHPGIPEIGTALTGFTGGLLGYIGRTAKSSVVNTEANGAKEVSKSQSQS